MSTPALSRPPADQKTAQASFERWAHEHAPTLFSQALRLTGQRTRAWDLVQDTFEHGIRHARKRALVENPRAWLSTILRNLFVSTWRRERRYVWCEGAERMFENLTAPQPDAEPAWAHINQSDVERSLEELPSIFREAFRLHALDGLSHDEIAQQLGIPRRTVATRVFRARRRLRTLLAGDEGELASDVMPWTGPRAAAKSATVSRA